MQIQIIQRPALFSDFFNLEIDYKNDFLEYINTDNHKFVTSLLNITKKRLNKKVLGIYELVQNKELSNVLFTFRVPKSSFKELFKKLIWHRAYRNIDRDTKHYFRVNNQVSLFVPHEHVEAISKAIYEIQKTATT